MSHKHTYGGCGALGDDVRVEMFVGWVRDVTEIDAERLTGATMDDGCPM